MSIEWLIQALADNPWYGYILPFLGAIFGGEGAILAVAALAASGAFPATQVFIMSFLGTMSSDIVWFMVGQTSWWHRVGEKKYFKSSFSIIAEVIHKVSRGRHFIALLITKFLYGTRIIMLLYLHHIRMQKKTFLLYNGIATFIWLWVFVPAGYLTGHGFFALLHTVKNIQLALGVLILIIVTFYILRIWMNKRFMSKLDQST